MPAATVSWPAACASSSAAPPVPSSGEIASAAPAAAPCNVSRLRRRSRSTSQLGGLILGGRHALDLVELERQQVELALASGGQLAQLRLAFLDPADPRIRPPNELAQRHLIAPAVGVEDVELDRREHQLAVLVLTVEREQRAAQLPQVGDGRGPAAHVCPGPPVGPHAPREHDLLRAGRQHLGTGQLGRDREHSLDVGLGGAGADDPAPGAPAEQQVERLGQQGLAGAGLAGHDVESRSQCQLGPVDQQQVLHPQFLQHRRGVPPGPDGSLSATVTGRSSD